MAQSGARFEPSHRMGDFVLRRWLAQGGMAELYLATPADLARGREVVVLKRVLPQFTRSESFARMFAREARLASMLHHPNIVAVYEGGGGGGAGQDCFFTMEYVHGTDLGLLLDAVRDRRAALPLDHALTIAVSMCAGLHYAHEACGPDGTPLQIVHRDVSPSNVLVSFDGEVKITDFGVATARAMTRLTEEGTRKGKLSYMSPEQATGETVDRRADVFAIATVLYELTTMERLFGGDNDLAIMYNILHRPRPSPREASPSYPAALEEIVMRAVSHDPTERFDTALQLQQALEGFAASVGLPLSVEALARFVRGTVPVPLHPQDDPKLWSSSMRPRSASHHAITMVEEGAPRPSSQPQGQLAAPTGPIPGLAVGAGTGVPSSASSASSAHSGTLVQVGAGPSAPWVVAPQPSSPWLRWLSIGLAVVALLVATVVGLMAWRVEEAPAASPEPAVQSPSVPASPAAIPQEVPVPTPVAPVPEATPPEPAAQPSEPPPRAAPSRAGGRKAKKKRKKRASVAPDPEPSPPEETSKKPSPTDTLLPIRE